MSAQDTADSAVAAATIGRPARQHTEPPAPATDIFFVQAPGSATIPRSSTHSRAHWPRDLGEVAFQSERSGATEVWVCDADGGNADQLTRFGGAVGGTPRWSPDGRRIVLDSRQAGQSDLFVIDASGGPSRQLTQDPAVDRVGSWSRDGRFVYFASNRSGTLQIWRMPADGDAAEAAAVPVPKGGGNAPFEFGTRTVRVVAELDPARAQWGLSVSPDGRTNLYIQGDNAGGDLMLVDNFR